MTKNLRERSGNVNVDSKLVSFLYELMRDHLTVGTVEELVRNNQRSAVEYSNGWLASYAFDVATRLLPDEETAEPGECTCLPGCVSHQEGCPKWVMCI